MRTYTFLALLLLLTCNASAQHEGTAFEAMVERVARFGNRIPQEKVYVHMDNTSYLQGDTIWFKAYLRRTDTDKPSRVSNTLYVELRDPDGYLKERKQIWMTNGEGDGFFALSDSSFCFGGYYELRAYSRWQLNWGAREHPHSSVSEKWFFNKASSRDFFRDYEKLYSRVFPIFTQYAEVDGSVLPVMFPRPLRRQFKGNPQPSRPVLTLYPEGGNLVAGVENNVAFEAAMDDGRYLEGWLYVNGDSAYTKNRGRGNFLITPQSGKKTEVYFLSKDGLKVTATLDKPDNDGVAVRLSRRNDGWQAQIRMAGDLIADSLAVTVMHEGRVEDFRTMNSLTEKEGVRQMFLNQSKASGVHQITIFDTQGQVLADRLFFVTNPKDILPTLDVTVGKTSYEPYEPISLNIKGQDGGCNVSVSVRSDKGVTYINDNGNILTEMLLASEIRGFVPQPGWFFEKDDEEHRKALDLLMMTQGWRRFPWEQMAQRGHFEIVHPAETLPVLTGAVHTYEAVMKFDPLLMMDMVASDTLMGVPEEEIMARMNERFGFTEKGGRRFSYGKDLKKNERADSIGATKELRRQLMTDGEKLRHEVKVRADFIHPHGSGNIRSDMNGQENMHAARDARDWDSMWGESVTRNGAFRMELPAIDEYCFMTLAASDTTRWSRAEKKGKKKHQWYWHDELSYPEFYLRLSFPYPNFVKPYNYYQTNLSAVRIMEATGSDTDERVSQMREVEVTGKKRNRLLDRSVSTPVVRMDALDAYNLVTDDGLLNGWLSSAEQLGVAVARHFVADMGQHRSYPIDIAYGVNLENVNGENAIDGGNPYTQMKKASFLSVLDSVFVYTDYAPRREGNARYKGSNQPEVEISFTMREVPRPTTIDRYIKLQGYARSAEFYSPDYSKRRPIEGEVDVRRTLYWNPYVKLDANGEAKITLYNNSFSGGVLVSAQGQSTQGGLLWNE